MARNGSGAADYRRVLDCEAIDGPGQAKGFHDAQTTTIHDLCDDLINAGQIGDNRPGFLFR